MFRYTVRVNLEAFISRYTDANKRNKASKAEKRFYRNTHLWDKNINIIVGKLFSLMTNTY